MQKLKGRVLVADWSVPKNEFSTRQEAQDGPTVQPAAAARGAVKQDEAEASEGSSDGSQVSSDGGSKDQAEASGGEGDSKSSPAAVGAGGKEGAGEELGDAAVHVRPGEKRMYETVLAGLLSYKDAADGDTKKPVKGRKRAATQDEEDTPGRKKARDAAGAKGEGTAGNEGKKPTWEGERSDAPAGQKQDGSGLIQRQVFVRNLPLDVLPSELSSGMQRFGDVKACRSARHPAHHVLVPISERSRNVNIHSNGTATPSRKSSPALLVTLS